MGAMGWVMMVGIAHCWRCIQTIKNNNQADVQGMMCKEAVQREGANARNNC
jgi:hypothetical protein